MLQVSESIKSITSGTLNSQLPTPNSSTFNLLTKQNGKKPSLTGEPSPPTPAHTSTASSTSTRPNCHRASRGVPRPAWSRASTARSPAPKTPSPTPTARASRELSNTWTFSRESRSSRSKSTQSSSAPAPTLALKISAPPQASCAATMWPPLYAPWSCRARSKSNDRRKPRACRTSSPPPVLSGANPAAACASA